MRSQSLILGVFILFSSLACSSRLAASPTDLLPAAADLPGWTQEEKSGVYTQDTLWDLMDGGAEVYQEYGVSGAISVRYKHPEKGGVLLEIYEMKDADAAYGIYSLNARIQGESVAVGDEARRTNYFLLFRKGTFYVTVTALSEPTSTMSACLELAKRVAARIGVGAPRPALVSRLPLLPEAPGRVVYVRGSLGLLNLYPFDASDPFRSREGVAGIYGDLTLFHLRFADAREVAARLQEAWKQLSTNPKYKVGGNFLLIDEKGNRLLLAAQGDCLCVAVGPEEKVLAWARDRARGVR